MQTILSEPKNLKKTERIHGEKGGPGYRETPSASRATLWGHIQIARVDHWFKNVFVFPGVVVAIGMDPTLLSGTGLPLRLFLGLLAICLVASSNYVINEVLDAPCDRQHPTKY